MSINRTISPLFILVTSCVLAAGALRAAVPEFVLASGGAAKAVIVPHGGITTNGVNFAARELADFLNRISGARFLVAPKPVPGYKTILVGTPYQAKQKEEIRIRVKDANTLEITGENPRSVVYATYDLLETFGCVFVAHDYDYVPTTNHLAIAGDYDKVDAPYFYALREAWSAIGWGDLITSLKMRLTFSPKLADSKGLPDLKMDYQPGCNEAIGGVFLPSRKYFKEHPEWYAYQRKDGSRVPLWVCLSNEGMWTQILKEIDEHIASRPGCREVSVARGDTGAFCECEKCTELVHQYPDPDGSEVYTVQDVLFSNRIGRHFAKKYPQVRFNMLPYGQRFPKNENLKFEPNVGGCSAELWRNHGLPADCNERSDYSLGQVCRLSAPGTHTYVWDYLANFRDWISPFPNFRIFAQTARYYKRIGVRGVTCQHQYAIAGDMSELKLWLYGKLLWNPDQDVDQLIDTYCNAAYGRGARFVKEYLDILEHARLRNRWTWYGCYVNDTSHFLTGDDCVKIYRALDNAFGQLRGDPRRKLASRARLAGLSVAILRYNDMIEPAQRLRVKLPSCPALWAEWKTRMHDSSLGFTGQWTAEGGSPWDDNTINRISTNAPVASDFTCKSAVVRADASKLTGGKKMTRQRDKDGTEYCQIKVAALGEPESTWMNPDFAEIGYTARPEDVGDWYVFATVRTGVTVPLDESSCYVGIYQSWFPNGVKLDNRRMEVANQAVAGRPGDNGKWRTVCLGKRRIFDGSRIWVMNGVLHPCDYIDVREITLVDPRVVESSTASGDAKDAAAKARSIVINAPGFDKQANVRIQDDRIDNFKYARLASFNTNAPVEALSWTVKPEQEGEWEVVMKVRIGAAFALDYDAALATVTIPYERCTECDAIQTPARVHVSGSLGDEAWQIVNLGRVDLKKGMKVNLVPRAGTNDVPHYVDVQSISLLDPAFIAKSQPALPVEPVKK